MFVLSPSHLVPSMFGNLSVQTESDVVVVYHSLGLTRRLTCQLKRRLIRCSVRESCNFRVCLCIQLMTDGLKGCIIKKMDGRLYKVRGLADG